MCRHICRPSLMSEVLKRVREGKESSDVYEKAKNSDDSLPSGTRLSISDIKLGLQICLHI